MQNLDEAPAGVTVTEDLEGVHVRYSHPQTARHHISGLIGIVLMTVLPLGGAALAVWPVAPLLDGGLASALLGTGLSVLATLVGLFLGLIVALGTAYGVSRLLRVPEAVSLSIRSHEIVQHRARTPIAEVLSVEVGEAPALVLRGGGRVEIGPGAPAEVRRWLGKGVEGALAGRAGGSPGDIPRGLRGLRQPSGR